MFCFPLFQDGPTISRKSIETTPEYSDYDFVDPNTGDIPPVIYTNAPTQNYNDGIGM